MKIRYINESYFGNVTKKKVSSKETVMSNVASIAKETDNKRKVEEFFKKPRVKITAGRICRFLHDLLSDSNFFRSYIDRFPNIAFTNDDPLYTENVGNIPKVKLCRNTKVAGSIIRSEDKICLLYLDNIYSTGNRIWFEENNFYKMELLDGGLGSIDIINLGNKIKLQVFYLADFYSSDAEGAFQQLNNMYNAYVHAKDKESVPDEYKIYSPTFIQKCEDKMKTERGKGAINGGNFVTTWQFALELKDSLDKNNLTPKDVFNTGSDDFFLKLMFSDSRMSLLKEDLKNIKKFLEKKYSLPFEIELVFHSRYREPAMLGHRYAVAGKKPYKEVSIVTV